MRVPALRGRGADVALVLAVAAAYSPTLVAGFLWDDSLWLGASPITTAANGWLLAWTRGAHFDYYPITSTVFWAAWRAFGNAPFGYHLLNVALHAFGAVVLWRLLRRLGLPGAWFAAALWAVHPVNVATVGWISELKSTLSFPLHALAAFVWIGREATDSPRRRFAAAGLHAASLLAKASGVMLPVGLLLWAAARGRSVRKEAVALAPMFALSIASGLVTLRFQLEGAIGSAGGFSADLITRCASAGRAFWFYLSKALIPRDLAGVYARDEIGSGGMAGLALALLLGTVLFAMRRRVGFAWFAAWAGYVVTLLPILGLVHLYYTRWSPVADHWQYAALPWALCAAGAGLARLATRAPAFGLRVACVVAIVGFTALSFRQSLLYRDAGTFWGHVLSRDPQSVLAHNEVGVHLARTGAVSDARAHFERAIGLDPRDAFAHGNLGRMQESAGDMQAAATSYRTAAELEPKHATARANLGRALASLGDLDGAIVELRRASDVEPGLVEAHMNLALVFRQRGEMDSAQVRLERVIELAPDAASARLELGRILVGRGDLTGAAARLRDLLVLVPEHAEAQAVLAAVEQELARRGAP